MPKASRRFHGCLLGGALGDALGYPIEFQSTSTIVQRHGIAPPSDLAYAGPAPAKVSDDTQMTLFTAEGFIRACQRVRERGHADPVAVIFYALRRWYGTQTSIPPHAISQAGWLVTERRLHDRRAPGNTCMEGSLGAATDELHSPR